MAALLTGCGSIKTVTASAGTGVGLPMDPEDHTGIYDANVTIGVNNRYHVGYGDSRIFGRYIHTGVSHNGWYLGNTHYGNDWGNWITVKKTITIFNRDKKKDVREDKEKLD